jgi:hypothetical protein
MSRPEITNLLKIDALASCNKALAEQLRARSLLGSTLNDNELKDDHVYNNITIHSISVNDEDANDKSDYGKDEDENRTNTNSPNGSPDHPQPGRDAKHNNTNVDGYKEEEEDDDDQESDEDSDEQDSEEDEADEEEPQKPPYWNRRAYPPQRGRGRGMPKARMNAIRLSPCMAPLCILDGSYTTQPAMRKPGPLLQPEPAEPGGETFQGYGHFSDYHTKEKTTKRLPHEGKEMSTLPSHVRVHQNVEEMLDDGDIENGDSEE